MAAELVGGALLGAFLNVVLDKMASPEVVNFISGKKLDPKLLQRLKTTLEVVRVVLNDADNKQIKDFGVKSWLVDLEDALYQADDFLDEVATKVVTQKEVRNMFSRLLNFQDREMVSRLNDIVERLESILKLKKSLDLKEIAMENSPYNTPSTSLLDSPAHIYGRDTDKEAIIKLLLDDAEEVSMIPIVGMGGIGKTTLAQFVYNDDNLKQIFDFKAWVCVSDVFDCLRVTKTITQKVTQETCENDDLNSLHEKLHNKLKEKKFLIVLDDVWTEDYDKWNLFKKPFQQGIKGSKILVSTRSDKVASMLQTVPTYHLNQLSSEDCWLVFANHACLSSISSGKKTALENIGREIVKKCRGLPLAAQSLGGILRIKDDIREWNNILNSDIWELPENESKIIPALRISYHYLPSQLKRCFVYCSLFPKDHEFERDDLIRLWIAEGLLSSGEKGKELEEVGRKCFDYLVARSFFQRSTTGEGRECFVMHDLIHDLATFLGGAFYFRSEELGKETMTRISRKTRHLSFSECSGPLLENSEVFESIKFLRTFLQTKYTYRCFNHEEKEVPMLLSKLKCSRVLSFSCFINLSVLPDIVGELIHLRYLDLSYTPIKALPESLCNLYNLQTLKLYYCYKLTILPSGMQKLVNLLHLDIRETSLKEMPKGMSKLNRLQYLSSYIVGKHEENGIKELGGLSILHNKSFTINRLENVSDGHEAKEARIMDKKHIERLKLHWSSNTSDDCNIDSQNERDILCKLQPHQDLQSLTIDGYRGTRFPDWVGNSSYHNMSALTLSYCKNCVTLPSLGQLPSLKYLTISDLDLLQTIDDSFYKNNNGSFPVLESLSFCNMPCWEIWSSFEPVAFPQLKYIQIINCPRLSGELPNHLPALEYLHIEGCNQLASSLPRAPVICGLRINRSDKVAFLKEQKHELLESLVLNNSRNSLSSLLPLEITFPNLKCLSLMEYDAQSEEGLVAPSSDKLKSLICQMNILFPKLEQLRIAHCPGIESLPEGGMPPCLRTIYIQNCEKLLSGLAWPSMDMLTDVGISGPCDGIKSFPKEGLLPPSLTCIRIEGFSSLETLDCKGLLHLTSLRQLQIEYCRKLENITGERLPASLIELDISRCPLLEERCRMQDPQIWPKISHIQSIPIDWKPIS